MTILLTLMLLWDKHYRQPIHEIFGILANSFMGNFSFFFSGFYYCVWIVTDTYRAIPITLVSWSLIFLLQSQLPGTLATHHSWKHGLDIENPGPTAACPATVKPPPLPLAILEWLAGMSSFSLSIHSKPSSSWASLPWPPLSSCWGQYSWLLCSLADSHFLPSGERFHSFNETLAICSQCLTSLPESRGPRGTGGVGKEKFKVKGSLYATSRVHWGTLGWSGERREAGRTGML